MLKRYFYSDSIEIFCRKPDMEILGELSSNNLFALEQTQRDSWETQIKLIKGLFHSTAYSGQIFFEYSIPRLGKRIDVLLIIDHVLFVIEFKVNETTFHNHAIDQVWDYALDLKNFHESSHHCLVAPILVSTHAKNSDFDKPIAIREDNLIDPICSNSNSLREIIDKVLSTSIGNNIDSLQWAAGRYRPTPTIVEAAKALYSGHSVEEIARSDAGEINLNKTSNSIANIISWAHDHSKKAICFVTGVPGAGKTLVGLKIAINHINKDDNLYSVYLSGNGPLVNILHEALARDKVQRAIDKGDKLKKNQAMSEVKMFIQNVHHFRDDCLRDLKPPIEHVAIFDEAQRAWNKEQTIKFMATKKGVSNFTSSEPEFLISCLNRHDDWAVIVCLVGGGQEINTGEVGISEWIKSILNSNPDWHIFISPQLNDSEYGAGQVINQLEHFQNKKYLNDLHLNVSMRSFRAENVSHLIKSILDVDRQSARETYRELSEKYPIAITRNLTQAKKWIRSKARGSERYGLVASSKAQRLKPHSIDIRVEINPVHWFLNEKSDVRSSYFLEDAATEFDVQGLELDWTCVTWDGDFRKSPIGWSHWSFRGDEWAKIHKVEIQQYQLNAYRVLLTRARQGMVIFIPEGDPEDHTRKAEYYDPTFEYLTEIGFPVI